MGSSLLTVSVRTVTTQLETSKMAPPVAELKAMTDAFEGIDRLAEGAPRTDGAPNFRRLPGFPIFGTGQTSVDGFEKCLEPVLKKYGDEKHVFWVNLRSDNCSEKQQRRKYFNSGIILDKNLWSMSMGSP